MQTKWIKRALVTCSASFLVLAGSANVLAVPPATIGVGPWQFFGLFVADCGDFNVLADGTVDGHIKVFFDKDGNWTKFIEFYRGVRHESTYYIAEDPDIRVSGGPGEVQRVTWYPDGTQAIVGLNSKITIPGHGVVIHDAGRIIFNVVTWEILFQAGPGDFYADTSPVCEFFGSLR